ncbi:MAG: GHMP kinase [Spartobacteria bacterium]|nr:GHMP kinase [Spartobacteria bacterium]
MMMGEHAVLRGAPCIVAAAGGRLVVTAELLAESRIIIDSDLGRVDMPKNTDNWPDWARFSGKVAQKMMHEYEIPGISLHIASAFKSTVGLGSSAAVSVAVAAATCALAGQRPGNKELHRIAYENVLENQQGRGSGADVAASVYGGINLYSMQQGCIKTLPLTHPITLVYCGYKKSTVDVINIVESIEKQVPDVFFSLFNTMQQIVQDAFVCLDCSRPNWTRFGVLMNIHQGIQDALGVNNRDLSEIIYRLRSMANILGVKISGSGLGDSVLALGHTSWGDEHYPAIPAEISVQGVHIHE